jgi:hypothetical protein
MRFEHEALYVRASGWALLSPGPPGPSGPLRFPSPTVTGTGTVALPGRPGCDHHWQWLGSACNPMCSCPWYTFIICPSVARSSLLTAWKTGRGHSGLSRFFLRSLLGKKIATKSEAPTKSSPKKLTSKVEHNVRRRRNYHAGLDSHRGAGLSSAKNRTRMLFSSVFWSATLGL